MSIVYCLVILHFTHIKLNFRSYLQHILICPMYCPAVHQYVQYIERGVYFCIPDLGFEYTHIQYSICFIHCAGWCGFCAIFNVHLYIVSHFLVHVCVSSNFVISKKNQAGWCGVSLMCFVQYFVQSHIWCAPVQLLCAIFFVPAQVHLEFETGERQSWIHHEPVKVCVCACVLAWKNEQLCMASRSHSLSHTGSWLSRLKRIILESSSP